MISTHFPVEIIVNIYSINGLKIKTIHPDLINNALGGFIRVEWDGKDNNGYKIANGTYFYHLTAKTPTGLLFENIYKISKVE